jgi:hypothetical protein
MRYIGKMNRAISRMSSFLRSIRYVTELESDHRAVFKNQSASITLLSIIHPDGSPLVDWIPLAVGSVRPTQGRTLGFAQVNGGSQRYARYFCKLSFTVADILSLRPSFNCVNSLRILGRWMRMWTIPNQSSLPKGPWSDLCFQIQYISTNIGSLLSAWTQFTTDDRLFVVTPFTYATLR